MKRLLIVCLLALPATTGFRVRFDAAANEIAFSQPNGVFTAKRK